MKQIRSQLSERIEMLRFPLIVGVVFIHMHTDDITFHGPGASFYNMLVNYIAEILARISVPLFFVMSGYLFFLTLVPTCENFIKKLKSRFYTLLIPFIIWNGVIFLFYAIAQNLPLSALCFTGERPIVLSLHGFDYIRLFFGLGDFQYPVAYQFWFVRDLIILVLFSPLLYFMLTKIPQIVLTLLGVLWFFNMIHFKIIQFDIASAFFFSLGGYFGIIKNDFSLLDRYSKAILLSYLLISLISVLTENFYLQQTAIFTGVLAAFVITKYLREIPSVKERLIVLAKYSFLLFAMHEPLLSIIRKILFILIDVQSNWMVFTLYLLAPVLTILCCILVYNIFEKTAPQILYFTTGNRA